jgi:hypothetical protein
LVLVLQECGVFLLYVVVCGALVLVLLQECGIFLLYVVFVEHWC